MLRKKEAIVKYDWKYVPTTRKDINNLIKYLHHDMKQAFISMGLKPQGDNWAPIPFNPLEKE